MTDTGQVPGEGLPENAGMVEQPGVQAPGAYTYLSETAAEDEDLLLPGAQGAWGHETPPPAPEPVVQVVHEPGPHETDGRDSGSVDLSAVRTHGQGAAASETAAAAPEPGRARMQVATAVPQPPVARRPLHLGPPTPDSSASPVRSLADRGPAGAPVPLGAVRQSGPPTMGPEYLDVSQPAEISPQPASPWIAVPALTSMAAPGEQTDTEAQAGAEAPMSGEAPVSGEVPPGAEAVEGAPEGAGPAVGQVAETVVPEDTQASGTPSAPEAASAPGAVGEVLMPQSPETPPNPELLHALDGSLDPQAPDPTPFPGVYAPAGEAPAPVPVEMQQRAEAEAAAAVPGEPVAQEQQVAHDQAVPEQQVAVAPEPVQDLPRQVPVQTQEMPEVLETPTPEAVAPEAVAPEAVAPEAAAPEPVAQEPVNPEPVVQDMVEVPAAPQPQPAEQGPQLVDPAAHLTDAGPQDSDAAPLDTVAQVAAPVVEPEAPQAPAAEAAPAPEEPAHEPVAEPTVEPVVPEQAAPQTVPVHETASTPQSAPADPAEAEALPTEPAAPEPSHEVPLGAGAHPEAVQQAVDQAPGGPAEAVPFPDAPLDARADQPVGQFVAVEGMVPTTPHLAPTPPHGMTVPPLPVEDQPTQVEASTAVQTPEGDAQTPEGAQLPVDAAPVPSPENAVEPMEPAATEQQPATTEQQPAAIAQQPAATEHEPEPLTPPHPEAAPTLPEQAQPAAPEEPQTVAAPDQATTAPEEPLAAVPDQAPAAEPVPEPEPAPEPVPRVLAPQVPAPAQAPEEAAPTATVPGPREPEAPAGPEPFAAEPIAAGADPDVVQRAEDLDTRVADHEESTATVEEATRPAGPTAGPAAPGYDDAEREAVLRVMRERRDIRNGFRGDPIPHDVLLRVLEAAHTAPSVGHSQPWDFVVIRSADTRRTMHELAQRQREAYAKSLPKGRAKQFKELKIEAILDTPVNIVVTADPTRGGRHTLGRHTQPQMAPYSSALAVENLWLAARAEGLGVGWVSFFDEREMVRALGLPEHLEVVAYLCVGYVDEFPEEPELLQAGWSKRRPLSWVVHEETYGRRALPGEEPHDLLAETIAGIRPLDAKALGEAWERQKRMTKPAGALGMLEIISAQLSGLSRQCPPPIPEPAAVAIFAGDHGVHAQGVTPWPQEVTAQMVANFLGGGAVCNAFAAQVGAEVCVVDVGVACELPSTPGLLPRKIRAGTADMTVGPALTREEVKQAIEVGIETARDLVAAGNKALLTGEMGIANTTASAALIAVFTDTDPSEVTGRGTGINDETLARKTEVVRRAIELHQPDPADPIGVLAAFGGLEHAAIVGLLLGGASLRTPVILDGVSAGAAALVARAIAPEVLAACIAGHRSAEPGHVAALKKLGLRPLVDLDLRLGEGTGALLALPMVQSTARAMHEVATFDSAGVTEK
ncbi:nicotinate-nucleotide--dimethylbenzimidazole phosphoribosyltransferase [Streptomyces phyllanthi]